MFGELGTMEYFVIHNIDSDKYLCDDCVHESYEVAEVSFHELLTGVRNNKHYYHGLFPTRKTARKFLLLQDFSKEQRCRWEILSLNITLA
jgi:hypothetical protein